MNTLLLKYAVEVEKTGSISKAAENLYMNQPNLSKAIRELELSSGITIFSRTSKGVFPTSQGKQFLELAKEVLARVENLEAFSATDGGVSATDISSCESIYINESICNMQKNCDGNFVSSYTETDNMTTINSISCAQAQVGIVRCSEKHEKTLLSILEEKKLSYETVFKFSTMLTFAANDTVLNKNVSDKTLSQLKRVVFEQPYLPFSRAKEAINENSSTEKQIKVSSLRCALETVSKLPECYTVCEPVSKNTLSTYNLVQRAFVGENFVDIAVFAHGSRHQENIKMFIDIVKETASRLLS